MSLIIFPSFCEYLIFSIIINVLFSNIKRLFSFICLKDEKSPFFNIVVFTVSFLIVHSSSKILLLYIFYCFLGRLLTLIFSSFYGFLIIFPIIINVFSLNFKRFLLYLLRTKNRPFLTLSFEFIPREYIASSEELFLRETP